MVLHKYYKRLKAKVRPENLAISQLRSMGSESKTAASKIIKQAFKDKKLDLSMYHMLLPSFGKKSMTIKFERSLIGTRVSSPHKEKITATLKFVENEEGVWELKSFTQRPV